jgi:SAM-dependent methyltransferase
VSRIDRASGAGAPVFDAYSRYYDLLYRDKAYDAEAQYVADTCRRHMPEAVTLLDLGCGTGRHAWELVHRGFEVTGVERSPSMVRRARQLHASLAPERAAKLSFEEGDALDFRSGRRFDVVTALFHVLSYQTQNAAVRDFLQTARAHLGPGGLFVFDCWYGPAVLTEQPEARQKQMADDEFEVLRSATPTLHASRNVVDVHYRVEVRERVSGVAEEIEELHSMRYFFLPELEWYLEDAGFELIWSGEFLSGRALDERTWNALLVARRRSD